MVYVQLLACKYFFFFFYSGSTVCKSVRDPCVKGQSVTGLRSVGLSLMVKVVWDELFLFGFFVCLFVCLFVWGFFSYCVLIKLILAHTSPPRFFPHLHSLVVAVPFDWAIYTYN